MQLALRNVRGQTVNLDNPYHILGATGLGLPPVVAGVERYAQQDGATLRHIRLAPRTVTIPFEVLTPSYANFWSAKSELYGFLSAVNSAYTLIATLPDGTIRHLDVYFDGDLSMPFDRSWGPLIARDTGRWIAYDPTWYDPAMVTWSFAIGGGEGTWGWEPDGLGFSAGWGASVAGGAPHVFDYGGTWRAYPRIWLAGPMTAAEIANGTTGQKIAFLSSYILSAGHEIEIDLRPGYKSVTHSVDGNVQAALTDDSDLGSWHLAPHPEAINGQNSLSVAFTGGTSASRVQIRFYPRYLALHP
jgi:hypothetical protein